MTASAQSFSQRTVLHADGRAVHAVMFGTPDGRPIVYSHGFPASANEAVLAHDAAVRSGHLIIALDRPGFGGSGWQPRRRLEDWASDVRLVADAIGLSSFSVLGVSGGAPTAIALAAELPDRVRSLTLVSGIAPLGLPQISGSMSGLSRILVQLGVRFPVLSRLCIRTMALGWRLLPNLSHRWFLSVLPEVDREILRRDDIAAVFAETRRQALWRGDRGVVTEFGLLLSDWQNLMRRVRVPTHIWHGDADSYVPFACAELIHRSIDRSELTAVAGAGHLMMVDRMPDVLRTLP